MNERTVTVMGGCPSLNYRTGCDLAGHTNTMPSNEKNAWLAERFEENRVHLKAVAFRILGSMPEAEDAVQETWLKATRAGTDDVSNLGGWLTTIVGRVSLDMLRSRKARREGFIDLSPDAREDQTSPEREALLADAVGMALMVVLDKMSPAERVAFVLHDVFDLSFEEISLILGKSPMAARQLASRGRRRAQSSAPPDSELGQRQAVIDAFLSASRSGDFTALLKVLDPEIVVVADRAAVKMGAKETVVGADAVGKSFLGRAKGARKCLVNGIPGIAWAPGGKLRVVFSVGIANGRIARIELIADPERLGKMDVRMLEAN